MRGAASHTYSFRPDSARREEPQFPADMHELVMKAEDARGDHQRPPRNRPTDQTNENLITVTFSRSRPLFSPSENADEHRRHSGNGRFPTWPVLPYQEEIGCAVIGDPIARRVSEQWNFAAG
jgi:hypothetical protein